MELKNMALSAEEAAEYASCAPCPAGEESKGPKYPYGLCIDLNDASLAKLGITTLPAVGSELMIAAKVVIEATGSSQRRDGEAEIRMSLQITDMSLSAPVDDVNERAAAKLWPT